MRSNLFRRNGTFHWRKRLPRPLARIFGDFVIRVSTRTHIPHVARERAHRLALITSAAFEVFMRIDRMALEKLTRPRIQTLMTEIITNVLNEAELERVCLGELSETDLSARAERFSIESEVFRRAKLSNDFSHAWGPLKAAMEKNNIVLDETDPLCRLAASQTLQALADAAAAKSCVERGEEVPEALARRISVQHVQAPRLLPEQAGPNAAWAFQLHVGGNGFVLERLQQPISVVYTEMLKDVSLMNWAPKTQSDGKVALRLFIETIGDLELCNIKTSTVLRLKDHMTRLPVLNGKGIYSGLTSPEAVKKADEIEAEQIARVRDRIFPNRGEMDLDLQLAKVERIKPKTINKYLDLLNHLFKWLKDKDKDARFDNPFVGTRFHKSTYDKGVKDERQAHTDDEALTIYETPCFTGALSSYYRAFKGSKITKDAKYWIPLMEGHAALRLEEAAQIWCEDIVCHFGIWCIEVRTGTGRKVKTRAGRRVVPIHQLLLDLGLLEYIERNKANGARHLFPNLKRDGFGNIGTSISKWFTNYRKSCGIYEKGKDGHSFRHSFDTHLQNKEIPDIRVGELMGHAQKGETNSRYFKGTKLALLKAAIDSIDYGIRTGIVNGQCQIIATKPICSADSKNENDKAAA